MTFFSKLDAANLWRAIEQQEAEDTAAMPNTKAALIALNRAHHRLEKLGWSRGIYCPKDGTDFAVVTFGSTGIFAGRYVGDWPDGDIWLADETCHPHGCLWKAIDKLTAAESARMEACIEDHRAYIDRLGRTFGDQTA